jgi:hypothetical protein
MRRAQSPIFSFLTMDVPSRERLTKRFTHVLLQSLGFSLLNTTE